MGDAQDAVRATNARVVCGCQVRVELSPVVDRNKRSPLRSNSDGYPRGGSRSHREDSYSHRRDDMRSRPRSPPGLSSRFSSREHSGHFPPPPSRDRYDDAGRHSNSRHSGHGRHSPPPPMIYDQPGRGRDRYPPPPPPMRDHSRSHSSSLRPPPNSSGRDHSRNGVHHHHGDRFDNYRDIKEPLDSRFSRSDRGDRFGGRPPVERLPYPGRSMSRKNNDFHSDFPHKPRSISPRRHMSPPRRFSRSPPGSYGRRPAERSRDMAFRAERSRPQEMRRLPPPPPRSSHRSSSGRRHSPNFSHSSRSEHSYHKERSGRDDRSRDERDRKYERGGGYRSRSRSPVRHFSPSADPPRRSESSHRHTHRKDSHFDDSQSPSYIYKPKTPPYSKSPSPPPSDSTPPHFDKQHSATYDYTRSRSTTPVEFLNDQYTLPTENYDFDHPPEEDQYLELDEVKDDLRDNDYDTVDTGLFRGRDTLFSPRHDREVINQGKEREVIAHSPDSERFVTVIT